MGFQTNTTSKIRIDDDELKLRQMVQELKQKGKDPNMIRDYLTQYQGYKTEAISDAFNVAGMEMEPSYTEPEEQTFDQKFAKDPTKTYLGGREFKVETTADYGVYSKEEAKQKEKENLVDVGLAAVNKKLTNIDLAAGHKSLDDAVGPSLLKWFSRGLPVGGKQDFTGIVEQIVNVDALDSLISAKSRGATFGALSDREMDLLKSAATKLGSWGESKDGKTVAYDVSEEAFKKELAEMKLTAEKLKEGLEKHKKEILANPLVGAGTPVEQPTQGTTNFGSPDEARKFITENPNAPGIETIQAKLDEYDSKKTDSEAPAEDDGLGGMLKEKFDDSRYSDILGDLGETYTGIFEAGKDRFQQGKDSLAVGQEGNKDAEATKIEKTQRVAGHIAGFGGDVIGEIMKWVVKANLSPEEEKKTKEVVETVGKKIVQNSTIEGIMADWEEMAEEDPGKAENIEAFFNIADVALELTGIGGATYMAKRASKEALEEGVEQSVKQSSKYVREAGSSKSVLKEVAEEGAEQTVKQGPGIAKRTMTATGEFVDDTALAATEKATGLNKDTIKRMIKNPEKFSEAEMSKITREATFSKVDNSISKRIEELSETGAGYDAIRASGNMVKIDKGFIEGILRDTFKLKIVNGKIVATTKSATRNAADLKAVEKFYNTWKKVDVMDADEFLNMRSDLADLADYAKIASGKTKASQTIGKNLRASFNAKYRNQIDGLEKLDAKFAPEKKELESLMKDYFKDGNIKDGAFSKLANLTNAGQEQRLARLKKLMPNIEEEVHMLKAIENIRGLSANKTGQYTRSLLAVGGGSVVGGPVGAVTGFLLANPSSAVGIIKTFGRLKKYKASVVNRVIDKFKTGKEMTLGEKGLFNKAIDNAEELLKNRKPGMSITAVNDPKLNSIHEAIKNTEAAITKNPADRTLKANLKRLEKDYKKAYDDIGKKGKGVIPSTKLEKEASKYKSADEFVKSQKPKGIDSGFREDALFGRMEENRLSNTPDLEFLLNSNNIPNNTRNVTIYRSAPEDFRNGDFVGLKKEVAERHLRNKNDKIWSKKVDIDDLVQGADQFEFIYAPKKITEQIASTTKLQAKIKKLYSEVKDASEYSSSEPFINRTYKEIYKLESQLTDIYNKANKK